MSRAEAGQPCGRTHSENSLGGGDVIVVSDVVLLPKVMMQLQGLPPSLNCLYEDQKVTLRPSLGIRIQ